MDPLAPPCLCARVSEVVQKGGGKERGEGGAGGCINNFRALHEHALAHSGAPSLLQHDEARIIRVAGLA